MPGATEALATWVAETRFDRLPARVVEETKLLILDWVGSCFAGANSRPATILRSVAMEMGGHEQATVLPAYGRTSAPLAALCNAGASHVHEMDDVHRAAIFHPGAPVIPAALALAEREDRGGLDLILAVVCGYEVGIRVGEALGPAHYERWHTTGTAGVLAAAAAAASMLRQGPQTALLALGSAGTQAAGLWEFLADGAMSKQLHPAKAAHDGVFAAMLAARGFTAATRVLEGEKGLLAAASPDPRPGFLIDGLDVGQRRYKVSEVSYKPHASCRHTHPAVDAALALAPQTEPDAIDTVQVRIYSQALDLLRVSEAGTPYAAKFSLPYCVATALVHRSLGIDRFTDDAIRDQAVRALMERVMVETDPAFDARYPAQWPAAVTVRLLDGRTLREAVDHPKGDPENPLTPDEIMAKFYALASPLAGETTALRFAALVAHLDDGTPVRELIGCLEPSRAPA